MNAINEARKKKASQQPDRTRAADFVLSEEEQARNQAVVDAKKAHREAVLGKPKKGKKGKAEPEVEDEDV